MKIDENKKVELIKAIINLKEIEVPELEETKKKIKQIEKSLNKLKTNIRCPKCNSWNVIKHGTRKTMERGIIQRYGCKDCKWSFCIYGQDYRMRSNKNMINKALKLRKKGKTYSQIKEILNNKISRKTIGRWLDKFQPPKEEKIIKRKIQNQYGEYEREFKIKI